MRPNAIHLLRQAQAATEDLNLRDRNSDPARLRLLTVPQVSDLLMLSRSSVYRMLADESLPSVKLGGARRIRLRDLEALLTP